MECQSCNRVIMDHEPVVLRQYGEIIRGKFEPTEEPSIRHEYYCGEGDLL